MEQKGSYRPLQGIDYDTPDIVASESHAKQASNFLFYNGVAKTIPGLTTVIPGITGNAFYARAHDFTTVIKTLVLSDDNKLYSLSAALAATQITGAAVTLDALSTSEGVNGLLLISGNAAGLIRWDALTGNTYTVLTDAPYRYVTSHLSRAIAAYNLSGGDNLLDPRTVAWSVAGDETDWTSFGAGSAVLADATDAITGLGLMRNTIVIPRSSGFHLGIPTGVSTPPFNWIRHSHGLDSGCVYPTTFTVYGTRCFYVGRNDVFTFDLVEPKPIGKKIRRELIRLLRAGNVYRGFVSESFGQELRLQYHLVPMTNDENLPSFVFDLGDGSWSRIDYGFATGTGWFNLQAIGDSGPALSTYNSDEVKHWDDDAVVASKASLTTKSLDIGPLTEDVDVTRALVLYRALDEVKVEFSLRLLLSDNDVVLKQAKLLPADVRWRRLWLDYRGAGQLPEFKVEMLTAGRFEFAQIDLALGSTSEFLGPGIDEQLL